MAYIDKNKAQTFLRTECLAKYPTSFANGLLAAADQLNKLPTSDVVEVKYGKWQKQGNEKKCSHCKFIYYSNNDDFNFCPNCGAKMDGERKQHE